MKHLFLRLGIIASLSVAQLAAVTPARAEYLATRELSVDSNLPSAVTNYNIRFTTATTASIGSIRFQFCTTRYNACVAPVGMDTMSAGVTLDTQFGIGGFTYQQVAQGEILLVRSSAPELAGTPAYFKFDGITNPSFSNVSFYIRIYTYASDDGTGAFIDEGGAVASINSSLQVQGITPETLSFCVGVSGNSCSDLTGQLVGFGDFSPTSTSTASTVMFAATNAPGGYAINIYGSTLASGTNVIPAMGSQTPNDGGNEASQIGRSQFGTNVVANTNPKIGEAIAGAGIATAAGGYGTANRFRFYSGDTIAGSPQPSDINKYTNSYMVNISKDQGVGYYTSTLSYICTGNF